MLGTVLAALVLVAADPTSSRVRETAYARVALTEKIAADPELVKAIVAKNQAVESPLDIKKIDEEWQRNPRYPLRKALTSGPCADRLRKLVQDDPIVVEAFLMDERGGLVCSTTETSDYWQGDEAKWQKTYRDGMQVFVDEPALDTSTGTFAVQLSRRVNDDKGKIGALTLTLKIPRSAVGR
jgi:hypothetical protein